MQLGATARLPTRGVLALAAAAALACALALAGHSSGPASSSHASAASDYGKLPLSFVPNRGQVDSRVRYYAQAGGFGAWFTRDRVRLAIERGRGGYALDLRFRGANPSPVVEPLQEQPGKVNYIARGQSHTNLPTYATVRYRELWPGIDLTFRGAAGKLKYEFALAPGADPSKINLAYIGAQSLSVTSAGTLLVHTPRGALRDAAPAAYQRIDGRNVRVHSRYALVGGKRYGFQLGAYDHSRPLVIDPGLAYSTYLGGSSDESANGIAVDSSGSAYVAGNTSSTNFPTTPGAYSAMPSKIFVSKLNPAGSALTYSTYLVSGFFANANSIAVDDQGSAYVTGAGTDGIPTTPGVVSPFCSGEPDTCDIKSNDGYLTKLTPDGSGLVYSTYLGGYQAVGNDVSVDDQGNAYVAGTIGGGGGIPTTPGAYDTTHAADLDAFVMKLNPTATARTYSTYLGGSDWEPREKSIAVDGDGSAYVTGYTQSFDFPTTPGAFDTVGAGDAFVTKFTPDGSALEYSTYLGGQPGIDAGMGIAVDASENAYVTGPAGAATFPTTPGAYDTTLDGGDVFVTKLNTAGSGLVYSTFLGGSGSEQLSAIAVNSQGGAAVTGTTFSGDFPATAGALPPGGNGDAFATVLNPTGSGLVYSTPLGSGDSDYGNDVAVDGQGSPYITGQTRSFNFPTTAGAYDTTFNGNYDAFVTKFDIPGTIVVRKDAVPDDPQNFNFTAGGGLTATSFQLDDDADPTLSNTRTFANVPPGSGYSIAEGPTGPAWYLGAATCDDGSPPSNIDVSAGETVTCTFTNWPQYPRPGGATPLRVPLVPAFRVCNVPNSNHIAPLDFPSCTPAQLSSNLLTTSTTGVGQGFARFDVLAGNPATPADEADVNLIAVISDVRNAPSGSAYGGKVILTTTALRITDRANGSSGGAATVQDTEFALPIDCIGTGNPVAGSTCSITTTLDTLVPGFAKEGKRAVISVQSVRVKDAGPDGDVGSPSACPPTCGTGDERTYLDQGLFAP